MKNYYKVVYNHNGRMFSAIFNTIKHFSWDTIKDVEYIPNEWSTPTIKGSKLFVFDCLATATHFSMNNAGTTIWRVKVKNPYKLVRRALINSRDIRAFWRQFAAFRKNHKCASVGGYLTPTHTFGASAVKLVEQVSR